MDRREIIVALVAILVAAVAVVIALHAAIKNARVASVPSSSPTHADGTIDAFEIVPGASGTCSSDRGCDDGSTCVQGKCTTHACATCVPDSTVELGNTQCLDAWDAPAMMERLVDAVPAGAFGTPIDSHRCENRHPKFSLSTPDGSCSISITNRCTPFSPS